MKSGEKFGAMGATLACAGLALAGMLIGSPRGRAYAQAPDESGSRIQKGFEIAPVPLNLEGKNPALVGLGSYVVNTEGCNDCHSAGPRTQYSSNPYQGKPKVVNQQTYLGGGRDFLQLGAPPAGAHIISRNLTPAPNNQTGLPGGDITLDKFFEIIRHGTDFDNLHPTCAGAPNTGCIPFPFDGNLLQIMPWPNFKDLTDRETQAIYEYLKAVPCIQGNYPGPGGPEANIPPEPADRCSH
jgi:hypothetical protein